MVQLKLCDWVWCKDFDHPIWVTAIYEDKIEGWFVTPQGECHETHFQLKRAKPCTRQEIDTFITSVYDRGNSQFIRMREQGTFFVPLQDRIDALFKLRSSIDEEIKRLGKPVGGVAPPNSRKRIPVKK